MPVSSQPRSRARWCSAYCRRRLSWAPDLVSEVLPELARPLPYGLMAHVDAAGRQHLFDHAQAERKAEVEPPGVADDLAGKAVAGVGGLGCGCHPRHLPVPAFPAKPRPKLTVPLSELLP